MLPLLRFYATAAAAIEDAAVAVDIAAQLHPRLLPATQMSGSAVAQYVDIEVFS